MSAHWNRRELLCNSTLAVSAGLAAPVLSPAAQPAAKDAGKPFAFSLNTATIQGQKLPVVKEVEIAAQAGYDAFEPWIRELDQYVKEGGDLKDLGKRIRDAGLRVESAIGFASGSWTTRPSARRVWRKRGATWTWWGKSAASVWRRRRSGRRRRPGRRCSWWRSATARYATSARISAWCRRSRCGVSPRR